MATHECLQFRDKRIPKIWDLDLFLVCLSSFAKDPDPGVVDTSSGLKSCLGLTNYSLLTYCLMTLLVQHWIPSYGFVLEFKKIISITVTPLPIAVVPFQTTSIGEKQLKKKKNVIKSTVIAYFSNYRPFLQYHTW